MALASLATAADLPTTLAGHADASRALAVASAAIRDAAGVPITETTATVTLPAPLGDLLRLPGPVRSVATVTLDGTAVAEYQTLTEGLWRHGGWGCAPVPVSVTYTFGLAETPEDIKDLCVQLAVAWLRHSDEGGGSTAGLKSVRIDDAAEAYTEEAAGQVSPVFIPRETREWLRARFSGGVAVVETL